MLQVYYGYGKGKTSAATGAAMRAAGSGMRVLFVQFFKDGSSGEVKAMEEINNIDIIVPNTDYTLFEDGDSERRAELKADYTSLFKRVFASAGEYDMIVLDEALDALNMSFIERELFINTVSYYPRELEVIITGHTKNEELFAAADYVTEFNSIKHPYSKGVKARRGIEY